MRLDMHDVMSAYNPANIIVFIGRFLTHFASLYRGSLISTLTSVLGKEPILLGLDGPLVSRQAKSHFILI